MLRPGTYTVSISASIPGIQMLAEIRDAAVFSVADDGSPMAALSQGRRGAVMPILNWAVDGARTGAPQ
jgi:hypothetical protein